jgi:hypothetical protein
VQAECAAILAIKTIENSIWVLWQNFANIWEQLCKTTFLLATKRIIKVVPFSLYTER